MSDATKASPADADPLTPGQRLFLACLELRDRCAANICCPWAAADLDGCRLEYDKATDTATVTTPAGRTLTLGPETLDSTGLVVA